MRDTLPDYSRKNFSEEPKNVHKVNTTIKEPKLSIIDDPSAIPAIKKIVSLIHD